jgi:hypothetical protein
MTNQQDASKYQNTQINFMQEGMELGCKAGFRLSTLYAISSIFFIGAFAGGSGFLNGLASAFLSWDSFIHAISIFISVAFVIFFVAIGPAAVLGTLTGMLLGKFAEIFIGRISKYFFVFSCALLSVLIAVLIHLFFNIQFGTYPFYMEIPAILYVLAGGWAGWQLYLKSLSQKNE